MEFLPNDTKNKLPTPALKDGNLESLNKNSKEDKYNFDTQYEMT